MSITVSWDDDAQTILRWNFVGIWTWDEFEHELAATARRMEAVPYPVSAICDMTCSGPLPVTGSAISHMWQARQLAQEQLTTAIFVGSSAHVRAIIGLFCTIYRQRRDRYLFASSIEEARALLVARQVASPSATQIP
jgi:hypothetical protein